MLPPDNVHASPPRPQFSAKNRERESEMAVVSTGEAIDWLAAQRRRSDRQSQKVVEYGTLVLEGGHIKRLGNDVWAFLEQVAIAALDLGRLELAELCVARLNVRFPQSPRVSSLQGMLLEASGEFSKALAFYEGILAKDETNLIILKRQVAVLKSMDKGDDRTGSERAISILVKYLDTYYGDAEAWQELAALYSSLYLYQQAIFALEELMLLVPHNSFFVLQYAETLLTAGEVAQAYKAYLRALEMCGITTDGHSRGTETRQGPWTRVLWGIKLVTAKLLSDPSRKREAEQVEAVDAMVTDLLLSKSYIGDSKGVQITRAAARKVLQ